MKRNYFLLLLAAFVLMFTACDPEPEPPAPIKPKPEQPTTPETTYKVGDLFEKDGVKGIVFRVDAGGKSGTMVALEHHQGKICWSTVTGVTGATNAVNGLFNLNTIKEQPIWETNFPAFQYAASHGDGWYLPVASEVLDIFKALDKINPKLRSIGADTIPGALDMDIVYWTSTEYNTGQANGVYTFVGATEAGLTEPAVNAFAKGNGSGQLDPGYFTVLPVKKFDISE